MDPIEQQQQQQQQLQLTPASVLGNAPEVMPGEDQLKQQAAQNGQQERPTAEQLDDRHRRDDPPSDSGNDESSQTTSPSMPTSLSATTEGLYPQNIPADNNPAFLYLPYPASSSLPSSLVLASAYVPLFAESPGAPSAASPSPLQSVDQGEDADQVDGSNTDGPDLDDPAPDHWRTHLRQISEAEMLEELEAAKTLIRSQLYSEIMAANGRINTRIVSDLRDSESLEELDPAVLSTIRGTIADGMSELYVTTSQQYSDALEEMTEAFLEKVIMGMKLSYYLSL
ncbi:hypothetical protein BGW39_000267 [Mortierella sp. 14UC]|nr:hypothetical protein BGW39_000267 [Mortierella sp. 14UC]